MKNVLLIPPTYKFGSLGDQALILGTIEALKLNRDVHVTILLPEPSALTDYLKRIPDLCRVHIDLRSRMSRLIAKISLFILTINLLTRRFNQIVFIGADVVDGRYGDYYKHVVYQRVFNVAKFTGVDLRIISFTYDSARSASASKLLSQLKKFASYFPRDSRSFSQFKNAIGGRVALSADASFCLEIDKSMPELIGSQSFKKPEGRCILVCPADRHKQPLSPWLDKWASTINELDYDYAYIVLHDVRKNYLGFCREISGRLTIPNEVVLSHDVRLVRYLSAQCELVASCLMHCALGGIAAGTPSLFLDYGNKGLALFRDLGLEEYVAQNPDEFIRKIKLYKDSKTGMQTTIKAAVSLARSRASLFTCRHKIGQAAMRS